MNVPITIGELNVATGFTGEIKLDATLTIKDGLPAGGPGDSYLRSASAKIAPQNVNANLVIDNSKMYVERGELGSTTFKSTVQVINDGRLDFNLLNGSVILGMNLTIGTAAGGGCRASQGRRPDYWVPGLSPESPE